MTGQPLRSECSSSLPVSGHNRQYIYQPGNWVDMYTPDTYDPDYVGDFTGWYRKIRHQIDEGLAQY